MSQVDLQIALVHSFILKTEQRLEVEVCMYNSYTEVSQTKAHVSNYYSKATMYMIIYKFHPE